MATPGTARLTTGPETPLPHLRRTLLRMSGTTPFGRLGVTHAFATSADALFTVSLAGSLFFNVSLGAARPHIIAYLAVTMAPFIVLTPLVGPLIDRFGQARRVVAAMSCLGRGILCLFVASDIRTIFLYPEAFGILVLEKAYTITKSALVPGMVDDHADLVAANSTLTRVSTIAGIAGGVTAAAVLKVASATPVLQIASLAYFAAAALAMRIPPEPLTPMPPVTLEHEELRKPEIRWTAVVMMLLRAAVGFLTFLVAFRLKRTGEPTWFFGVVAIASITGGLLGTILSPTLRRRLQRDEPLLSIALLGAAAIAVAMAFGGGRASVPIAVFTISSAVTIGRQGFDSILQRDAPDAARGRSFARFETLFQLLWVLGSLTAVLLQPSTRVGLVIISGSLAIGAFIYVPATRTGRRRSGLKLRAP